MIEAKHIKVGDFLHNEPVEKVKHHYDIIHVFTTSRSFSYYPYVQVQNTPLVLKESEESQEAGLTPYRVLSFPPDEGGTMQNLENLIHDITNLGQENRVVAKFSSLEHAKMFANILAKSNFHNRVVVTD